MATLPTSIEHVKTPPLKCQGIKTKLVPFIFEHIQWENRAKGRWIEPFLGSGVVVLNLAPKRALLVDTNQHIITLYQSIQRGEITARTVRGFLQQEGTKLAQRGGDFYYDVRERFNSGGDPLDFLFLNRSCFNGVMRFNKHGKFNVPFGHKPNRFSKAYITKIVNQVAWVEQQMRGKDWEFRAASWESALAEATPQDFVYLDPPYIGRHTDYYTTWGKEEARHLASVAKQLESGFALSMWLQNRYRKNDDLEQSWTGLALRTYSHFYHVGSKEAYRNEIQEALLIKPGYIAPQQDKHPLQHPTQATLPSVA